MRHECPFCWSHNVREVSAAAGNGQAADRLMLCMDCERWYWAGTREEVLDLAGLCYTIIREPEKCIEDVLYPLRSGYLTYPAQKAVELNLLCSDCPHRCFFLPGKPRSVSIRKGAPAQQGSGTAGGGK